MISRRLLRAAALWAWSIFLTGLTLILGAVSLKSLRRGVGRSSYWAIGLAIAATLFVLQLKIFAAYYLSVVILIGLFDEWEELGMSLLASGFFSLIVTGMVTAAGVAVWIARTGSGWREIIISRLEDWFKPAAALTSTLQVNAADILLQLPSVLIVLWLGSLYVSVMLENRVAPPVDDKKRVALPSNFRLELAAINIPSIVIWAFILALLGAFGDFGLVNVQAFSVNVLNVCLMLFFFQGLAVVFRLFAVFRVGVFWQVMAMIVIIGQLFLLVSLLGLVDHWVDFRSRLSKRREEMNKELQ